MNESAVANQLSVQERLLLAQAVHKLGAVNWPGVSKLLLDHPCCANRPEAADLFSPESCEAAYIALMASIGINVPAPDAMKPLAKVNLRLAQTFYVARMQELKDDIAAYEQRFTSLMTEINQIKSGELDTSIMSDIRASLVKRYGKKTVDAWVPAAEEIQKAVAAGPVTDEEKVESTPAANDNGVKAEEEEAEAHMDGPEQEDKDEGGKGRRTGKEEDKEVDVGDSESPTEEPAHANGKTQVVEEKADEEADEAMEIDDAEDKPDARDPQPVSPANSAPVSELSPPPSPGAAADRETADTAPVSKSRTRGGESASASVAADSPAPSESLVTSASTRGQKRKAEVTVARPAKRGLRGTSPTILVSPSLSDEEDKDEEDKEKDEERDENKEDEDDKGDEKEDKEEDKDEEQEDPEPTGRGRRMSKRATVAKKGGASMESPTHLHALSRDLSPPASTSRRAQSAASSTTSATPVATTRRAAATRSGRGRDGVAVKEEQEDDEEGGEEETEAEAAEEEEDAEEEAEEERRSTRVSARKRQSDVVKQEPLSAVGSLATPSGDRRSKRGSTRTQRESVDEDPDAGQPPDTPSEPPSASGGLSTRASRSARHSSPRAQKHMQKLLNSLFDSISEHRNGNVFMNPVRKNDAPDYFEIVKRPMDLRTVKMRIKDGTITTIEEFTRDTRLIFANAMMYNRPRTAVYDMAKEMLEFCEDKIAHFKNVQHHVAR